VNSCTKLVFWCASSCGVRGAAVDSVGPGLGMWFSDTRDVGETLSDARVAVPVRASYSTRQTDRSGCVAGGCRVG